ncbi:helix-turn-helix domain-containing protein [Streptomyces xantholiticus]
MAGESLVWPSDVIVWGAFSCPESAKSPHRHRTFFRSSLVKGRPLDAKLAQQAIAERTGMDRPAYQDIEYGNVSPLLDSLLRISDAIGVSVADLVRE